MKQFVVSDEDNEAFGRMEAGKDAAIRLWNNCGEQLQKADDVLRSLSSYVGQGLMADTECLDYDECEARIRQGIDSILAVEIKRRERAEAEVARLAARLSETKAMLTAEIVSNNRLCTTNAAQAEQLAKLEATLRRAKTIMLNDGFNVNFINKVLSKESAPSIPPEPQAGVELMDELMEVLEMAKLALETSDPAMKHYPEPVIRHCQALIAVKDAIAKYKGVSDEQ